MRCSAAELFAPRLPTGARFVSRSRFWLTSCFVLATTTCGRPLRRAGLEIARNARRLNIRPDSRAALRCPLHPAFTQNALGTIGLHAVRSVAPQRMCRRRVRQLDDDFARFGRLDETRAADHAATVLIHLSSGRIQGVRTAAAGTSASVVEGGTRPDRPQRASQERLRRRLVSVLHL